MNQFKMGSHQLDYRAKGNPFQSKQITSMLDLEQAYRRPINPEIARDMARASNAEAERNKKIIKGTPKKTLSIILPENKPTKPYLSPDKVDSPGMSTKSKIDANYIRLSE